MKYVRLPIFALVISLFVATAAADESMFPPEPSWHRYTVTKDDAKAAAKAGQDILTYLYGASARNVSRFNRLSPKFVWPGRTLKVPEMLAGQEYTPMPSWWPKASAHPKYVLIALDRQFLGAYEYGRLVASYPIASGRKGYETPAGNFTVLKKKVFTRSTKYPEPHGGAPMPFAHLFDGAGYLIHAGDLPGKRASHGCVRMLLPDAEALFGWTEIGIPVKVMKSL